MKHKAEFILQLMNNAYFVFVAEYRTLCDIRDPITGDRIGWLEF